MILVGTKVKIKLDLLEGMTGISYIETYIGKIATVVNFNLEFAGIRDYKLDIDNGKWAWHEKWLIPLTEEELKAEETLMVNIDPIETKTQPEKKPRKKSTKKKGGK